MILTGYRITASNSDTATPLGLTLGTAATGTLLSLDAAPLRLDTVDDSVAACRHPLVWSLWMTRILAHHLVWTPRLRSPKDSERTHKPADHMSAERPPGSGETTKSIGKPAAHQHPENDSISWGPKTPNPFIKPELCLDAAWHRRDSAGQDGRMTFAARCPVVAVESALTIKFDPQLRLGRPLLNQ
jgi:hypothetical protein